MKRLVCVALATILFVLSASADASAQTSIFVGGGATIPTGDFKDFGGGDGANTGWTAMAGAQFAAGESGLTVGPRVFYGSNKHDTDGDKTNLYGAMALANFNFGDPGAANPFLWGEFGVMSHAYKSEAFPANDDTSTAAAWSLGAGVGFPLGDAAGGFVAAGYTAGVGDNSGTTLFGVYAGVNFAVGGG
jgi:hypothetical protein